MRKFLTVTGFVFLFTLIGFTSTLFLPAPAIPVAAVDFLGQAILPTGKLFQKTEVGGLSGITYDPDQNVYYAISDDRSEKAPARFFTLKIDLSKETLKDGNIIPIKLTKLVDKFNKPFAKGTLDPEGIALTNQKTVFISSEGNAAQLVNPFIKEFSLSGQELNSLILPEKFLPSAENQHGVRNNLAFESLTITPNKKHLFTATENSLLQDDPASSPGGVSPVRILQYNLLTKQLIGEFLYLTETAAGRLIPTRFRSGLADLVALDNQGHFLSLERSVNGLGFSIRLFEVALDTADNIQNIDSLNDIDLNTIKPVDKKLLLDLSTLKNVRLDNIEGLTLGPRLADGRQLLILISDNNFSRVQRTQILAIAINTAQPD